MAGFGVGVLSAGAIALAVGFGPLDPPAGPVTETSPSLADLEAKIDALGPGALGDLVAGPGEVFRAPALGALGDNQQSDEIISGRVYVKSMTVAFCDATLFDGPGSVGGDGRPASGDWIARNQQIFVASGNEFATQYTANTVPVEQIVENGLHIAWDSRQSAGFVYVLYRPLPEQP